MMVVMAMLMMTATVRQVMVMLVIKIAMVMAVMVHEVTMMFQSKQNGINNEDNSNNISNQ